MRHIKIVDFSSAILLPPSSDLSNKELTPEYSAPELIEGCENFGAEICVWNLGIIVYYLIVGTLPFQSPYFDHSRRKRITRFTVRGLTAKHTQAMQHLTQTCKVFLRQTIEPKAILRIPLLEIPENEWVTNQGKLIFQTFRPCGMHIKSDFEAACQLAQTTSVSGSGSANFPAVKGELPDPLENETNRQSLLKRMSHFLSGGPFSCAGRRGRAETGQKTMSEEVEEEGEEEAAAVENVPLTTMSSSLETSDSSSLNNSEMARKSSHSVSAFGEETCNSMIEALTYLSRFCKLAFSTATLSVLEQPVGDTSATFQILLHKVRKQTGIYLLDHTLPGWPVLVTDVIVAAFAPTAVERIRRSPSYLNCFEDDHNLLSNGHAQKEPPCGAGYSQPDQADCDSKLDFFEYLIQNPYVCKTLATVNWWWYPALLRQVFRPFLLSFYLNVRTHSIGCYNIWSELDTRVMHSHHTEPALRFAGRNAHGCVCECPNNQNMDSQRRRQNWLPFAKALQVSVHQFTEKCLARKRADSGEVQNPRIAPFISVDNFGNPAVTGRHKSKPSVSEEKPKSAKANVHHLNALGIAVVKRTNPLRTEADTAQLASEFKARLRRTSMRPSMRSVHTSIAGPLKNTPSLQSSHEAVALS
ncbi:hypothetical protein AAHC03_021124 [Spirometra sp. Aus1]